MSYPLLVTVVLGLLLPLTAYQQAPFVVCSPPASASEKPALGCKLGDLLQVPVRIFNYLLTLAAFALLGVIVFAGLRMMWFYLAESPEAELQNAKYTLTRGIVGFAIVVGAILIVDTLLFLLGLRNTSALGIMLRGFGIGP